MVIAGNSQNLAQDIVTAFKFDEFRAHIILFPGNKPASNRGGQRGFKNVGGNERQGSHCEQSDKINGFASRVGAN